MNRDDVIRMAKEAGIVVIGEAAFKLCQLVAEHEREACAELRHRLTPFDLYDRSEMLGVMNQGLDDYQNLIRARGKDDQA